MPARLTTEEFIERSQSVHNYKYNYDETIYVDRVSKLKIICPIHGEFWQRAGSHYKGGVGCKKCHFNNKSISKEEFVQNCVNVHGNLYDYDEFIYLGSRVKGKIVCPYHGVFEQLPTSHIRGSGCPICANDKGGYSLAKWIESSKSSKSFDSFKLYVIKCWNNSEVFYKIGRTFTTIGKRFDGKNRMPYNWVLLKQICGDAETIFNLENELKRKHKDYKYVPKIEFKGMYECFSKIDTNG